MLVRYEKEKCKDFLNLIDKHSKRIRIVAFFASKKRLNKENNAQKDNAKLSENALFKE